MPGIVSLGPNLKGKVLESDLTLPSPAEIIHVAETIQLSRTPSVWTASAAWPMAQLSCKLTQVDHVDASSCGLEPWTPAHGGCVPPASHLSLHPTCIGRSGPAPSVRPSASASCPACGNRPKVRNAPVAHQPATPSPGPQPETPSGARGPAGPPRPPRAATIASEAPHHATHHVAPASRTIASEAPTARALSSHGPNSRPRPHPCP